MAEVSWIGVLFSLILVVVAIALSLAMGLRLERSLVWASARAAAQLLAVGLVFRAIFLSSQATLFAGIWVAGMVIVAAFVIQYRARRVPGLWRLALASLGLSTAVVLAVIFGLGVMEVTPVALVVIAGITIGNTVPSTVLAVDRVVAYLSEQRGLVEVLLAHGFDARGVTRVVAPLTARTALIPQIERTKVVGLIALPGAMTGLLLAGVPAFDAVLVQLVVMYLVLGSVAVAVVVVTAGALTATFAGRLRVPEWIG